MNIIEKQRIKKGLSQERLGELVKLSQPTISLICTGNIKSMKFTIAKKLAKVLGITIQQIFSDPELFSDSK